MPELNRYAKTTPDLGGQVNEETDPIDDVNFPQPDWSQFRFVSPAVSEVFKALEKLTDEQALMVTVFARALYEPPAPSEAPEFYKDRGKREELGSRKENPAEFIARVYSEYMEEGLSMTSISKVDPQLRHVLGVWLANNELPKDVKLLKNDDLASHVANRLVATSPNAVEIAKKLRSLATSVSRKIPT